jgi:hypothetical protein
LQVPEIIRENNFENWHGLCSLKWQKPGERKVEVKGLLKAIMDKLGRNPPQGGSEVLNYE